MSELSESRLAKAKELLYTTIFDQVFSPCGKFLVACSNFGRISVFSLRTVLGPELSKDSFKPFFSFKGHIGPVYCLLSTDNFLISAGTGSIKAYSWSDILTKVDKVSWSLDIPSSLSSADRFTEAPESNSMTLRSKDGCSELFVGCGDNKIHSWDITTGSYLHSYTGHTDYVHCVTMRTNEQQFLSASEDGSVRLWDVRVSGDGSVHTVEPYRHVDCERGQHGKWIACVCVDKADDWMVCGGGPSLSMWHLRAMSLTAVFLTPAATVNQALFHSDMILSGGSDSSIQQWSVNGERRASVPCSPSNIFSLAVNDKSDSLKVLTVAGSSHKIDVCTNFGYKALSLSFI